MTEKCGAWNTGILFWVGLFLLLFVVPVAWLGWMEWKEAIR